MKASLAMSFLLICSLFLSLLAFVPQVWAHDWSIQRPRNDVDFVNERIEGAATDGKASVGIGIHVIDYEENSDKWPFDGNDGITAKIVTTGNTRKIVEYTLSSSSYYWHSDLSNELVLGDDAVGWIDVWRRYGMKFRFYGGAGDAEYEGVWVSSNGVLFFNDTCTDRYYSSTIPNKRTQTISSPPSGETLNPTKAER